MIIQELVSQISGEIAKLIISGTIGGFIAHFLSVRLFRRQKKIEAEREFQLKRLDALRDLRMTLHWIYRDITYNWEKPAREDQTPDEYMFELMNKFNYWETLFLKDKETTKALNLLNSLIGTSREAFHRDNNIFKRPLGEIIIEIKSIVDGKIIEIEKSLTK
jgi:hypothetical protein